MSKVEDVPGFDPKHSVMDSYRMAIAQQIAPVIGKTVAEVYNGVDTGRKGADFALAIARYRLGGKPEEWGTKILEAWKEDPDFAKVEVAKGFFYAHLAKLPFTTKVLSHIASFPSRSPSDPSFDKHSYGSNENGKGKKTIVEFSSPNIAKPFHAGHLRSTIIGAFLANLYEMNGWEVVRMNYLGDWGKQFGLLAVGFQKYGSEELIEENAIQHLFEVYVKINADASAEEERGETTTHDAARLFFKHMEDGDKASLAIWSRFRDLSIVKLKDTYARLNIRYDDYNGESQTKPEEMTAAVDKLQDLGMITEDRGALLVDLKAHKLEKVVVRKGDGTTIYATRDIGSAKERHEKYQADKLIYVVASQQTFYLQQLFKILELMGYEWAKPGKIEHITFGMVQGMSTRKGTVKFLDDILDEAKDTMMAQMKKNEVKFQQIEDPERCADVLGISAVKIQDMSAKRHLDYVFNLERMTSFEGDTGVYIQYAHVRLASVERKNPNVIVPSDLSKINLSLLTEEKVHELVYLLASFPDVVRTSFANSEPSTIVTFLFRLAHLVSQTWDSLRVSGVEEELAIARLFIFICARDVLGNGMRLLTLTPLDRM